MLKGIIQNPKSKVVIVVVIVIFLLTVIYCAIQQKKENDSHLKNLNPRNSLPFLATGK